MYLKGRRLPLLAGAAVFFLALVVGAALFVEQGTSVVVRDEGGRQLERLPLPESGRFELEYVHSYYRVPAVEHFVAGEPPGFRLAAVSSTNEGVLDYYELEGARSHEGEWVRLRPEPPPRFDDLPLIATEKGRRTLVVSGEQLPLFTDDGPRHLTLGIERDSLLARIHGLSDPGAR